MSNHENKPIRIAQIMGKLWAGGVESVMFNYYRAIDKKEIQFDFFYDADSTVAPPTDLVNMGARFYKIPPYQKLPIYLKTLKEYFRKNHYMIVHSHINTLSIFPLLVAWSEHIPVRIAHSHSVPEGKEFKRNTLKYFLRIFGKLFATDYFACSEKAGRWMWGNQLFDAGKVYIVKNAINFRQFQHSQNETSSLRRYLGLNDKFVIGHVGRFTYAKNHIFLISVFKEICKLKTDAVLLLVGDGELHNQIIEELNNSHLKNKTVLVGKVSDPENYYRLFDVMILPSIFEGLPLTAIESQVAGVPIVVSEAIPDEAVISNCCIRKNLTNSLDDWVNTILKISNDKVILNKNSQDFDVEKQARNLCLWYMEHGMPR